MKSDIGTLIIFYLNRDFRTGFQMFARFELITLYVRPHNVVGFARRYTLRKLARVIGIKLPARFFLIRAPYLYLDAVKRMAVRIPHRPEDQSVWLCLRLLPIARPSPPTIFSSTGLTVTPSKSVPRSGHETTAPSSTSSSSISRSVSHSGQYTMISPLLYLGSS